MDVKEAIRARRTAHLYKDEEIDPRLIDEALELALTAPNHHLTFPWRFVVVGKETRSKLMKRQVELKAAKSGEASDPEARARLEEKIRRKMLFPAAMVAFCVKRNPDPVVAREDYATVACAIQNFCLALKGSGWDSKWSTGAITREPETYGLLGVDESQWEIVGFVWVGHTAVELPERRRPALAEVMTRLP